MSHSRVALLVIVTGALFSACYFTATNPLKIGQKNIETASISLSQIKKLPGELLTTKSPLEIIGNPSADNALQNTPEANQGNLTSQIIDGLSGFLIGQINLRNSEGPIVENGKNNIVVPNEEEITTLINQQIEDFSAPTKSGEDEYHPKVSEATLTLIKNASRSAQIDYVNNLLRIAKQYSTTVNITGAQAINDLIEKKNPATAKELASMYGSIGNEYAKLAAPANWSTLHKQVLSYYFTAESIWQDIANYEQDPAQASITANDLPILEKAGLGITELILREMQKNSITLDQLAL